MFDQNVAKRVSVKSWAGASVTAGRREVPAASLEMIESPAWPEYGHLK